MKRRGRGGAAWASPALRLVRVPVDVAEGANSGIDPLLRAVDAAETDAFGVVVVQDFDSVAVEDAGLGPVKSAALVGFSKQRKVLKFTKQ
jgi:hypothetical protein